MKVIFHIDERSKWQLTLGNAQNMLAYAKQQQENWTIEILANSEAVKDVTSDTMYAMELNQLLHEGVCIALCHNALQAQGISEDSIWEGCSIVSAGVVELAQKQAEGYAYIKP